MTGRASGRYVRREGGYRAFVPEPLPPAITWTAQLASALSDADRAIGRLAGEGRGLPNPNLLMRPFITREASSRAAFEGTEATLGELLAAEAGAAVERSPADLREVANYVVALEYGVRRLKTLPLSLRLVRELHERLMKGVRTGMQRKLKVAFTTAQRAIDRLETARVLVRVSEGRRNRLYCAKALLSILEEPAKL